MSGRYFIPFAQVRKQKALIVDSMHPSGLVLSHWRGAPTPCSVRGDSSADIVLNALQQQLPGLACEAVTANHFDIDGFVGVWALIYPEIARENEQVLRQMARIGDFRELNLEVPAADKALKLVCWINAKEKELFYPPFGAEDLEENEVVASVPKFNYFLEAFGDVLKQPEKFAGTWEPEYQEVISGYQAIQNPDITQIRNYPDIGLTVVHTAKPVHYYALFGVSEGQDMVLAQYGGNRYELEYKYTTWIDLDSRPTWPRITLAPLARKLNTLETAGRTWVHEQITDTGPILRLQGEALTKKQRYANPMERPIYASGIGPEQLEEIVIDYYKSAYQNIQPKKYWSWKEIKALNKG